MGGPETIPPHDMIATMMIMTVTDAEVGVEEGGVIGMMRIWEFWRMSWMGGLLRNMQGGRGRGRGKETERGEREGRVRVGVGVGGSRGGAHQWFIIMTGCREGYDRVEGWG